MLQSAYDKGFAGALALVEKDLVPDAVIRRGVRYLLAQRVKEVRGGRRRRRQRWQPSADTHREGFASLLQPALVS